MRGKRLWVTSDCSAASGGDAASVLGFLLSLSSVIVALVGFFLTLRGQRKIREAAEAAARRATKHIALAEVSTLLRQVEAMRDAARHQIWLAAVIRGGEGRHVALSLMSNRTLNDVQNRSIFEVEEILRLGVQYVEQRLLPQGHGTGSLSAHHYRTLGTAVRILGRLRGELQSALTEA